MAQLPYFVFSPNTMVSIIGLLRGEDKTPPTPASNWHDATVDVVIPAYNEQDNIVRCLASVLKQTLQPRSIVLVDDGSSDATAARARAFCDLHGADIVVVQRSASIGKTPTIKQQTRTLDSDVLFVLDADTVLESNNYIERIVHDLYQGVGIASAFGSILPLREKDRRAADESAPVRAFAEAFPSSRPAAATSRLRRLARGVTNLYREVLYLFLQRIVFRGQMEVFGTVCNPAGCAVAYRRAYLETLFDTVEPQLGDDLTNSEDIFIGLAMLDEGYRNIQVTDVFARTLEPEVQRVPKQLYLWSSAFLQSAFYFDPLLKSPFRILRRWRLRRNPRNGPDRRRRTVQTGSVAFAGMNGVIPSKPILSIATDTSNPVPRAVKAGADTVEETGLLPGRNRRVIQEPYRQAFGCAHTTTYGRPIGWTLVSSALEKIAFPTILLVMVLLGNWEGLLITVAAETFIVVAALMLVMKNQRLEYLVKGLAVIPVRYALTAFELVTIARFATDLWVTGNRKWRK